MLLRKLPACCPYMCRPPLRVQPFRKTLAIDCSTRFPHPGTCAALPFVCHPFTAGSGCRKSIRSISDSTRGLGHLLSLRQARQKCTWRKKTMQMKRMMEA